MVIETWLKTDRKKPIAVKALQGNLFSADNGANLIGVEVVEDGNPATLSGGVIGYVVRADGATVVVDGTLSDNKATVTLPASCYAVVGPISIVIKVGTTTVGACTGYVYRSSTDEFIDPGHVVPSLQELLAQIENCRQATTAANSAASSANTAASNADGKATLANTAASIANEKAGLANTAAQTANTAAGKINNMTVSATGLSPTASPTATITEVDGHKHIAFGLVKGDPGDATIDDTAGEGDTTKVWSADKSAKLEAKTDRKAPAIYEEIESVQIASFADGADDMPVKDLKVAIEPVQDLHGYDHPWPGGIVPNLIPDTTDTSNGYEANKYLTSDGAVVSGNDFYVSEYFAVEPSTVYTLSKTPSMSSSAPSICFYDSGKTYISGVAVNQQNEQQITTPADAAYARCSQRKNMAGGFYQFELGNTATELMPYSNVCPITGWTGANVTITNKNLADASTTERIKVYRATTRPIEGNNGLYLCGAQGSSDSPKLKVPSWAYSDAKFSFTAKEDVVVSFSAYVINYTENCNGYVRLGYADEDNNFVRLEENGAFNTLGRTDISTKNVIIPKGGALVLRTSPASKSAEITLEQYAELRDIQIEISPVATAYEEPQKTIYPITFPSEPGTVYGGTLDVTTGVLTVDRKSVTIDGSAEWTMHTTGKFYASVIEKNEAKEVTSQVGLTAYKSNQYLFYGNGASASTQIETDKRLYGQRAFGRFWVYDSTYSTLEEFTSALNTTPLVIVYPLETPIQIPLTPTEITTILGLNNIFSDAGDVSVTYPADTKAYIDNQIANTRKLIAGIETEFKASKPYSVGDMLIIGNDLYKVSASIASGATITVDTNVTKTTVAEQLIALANA